MLQLLHRFRVLHCDLHAILGDDYGEKLKEEIMHASEDVEKKVLECIEKLGAITGTQGKREPNDLRRKSNCGVRRCWARLATRQKLRVTAN